MKPFKPLLAALAVASLIITGFGFTNNTTKRKWVSKTWYYNDGAPNQRLETGYVFGPVIERTIVQSTYTSTTNWNDGGNSGIIYSSADGSSYVLYYHRFLRNSF